MKVLTIIVSYNFEPWVDLCLGSLRNSAYTVSVIVIDNGSTDKTIEIITRNYPEILLLQNKSNMGFGAANNIGFNYAIKENFDYVFLLNQDAYIEKETIGNLIVQTTKNNDFGIISPIHLNGKGDNFDFGFKTYSLLTEVNRSGKKLVESRFINAAMWLIPVSVLLKVGGFAPIFSHYGEDLNYVKRLKFWGFKIGYAENAFGYHCREDRPINQKQTLRNTYLYFLSEAVNPNYSLLKSFAFSYLATIKQAMGSFIRLDWNNCLEFLKIYTKLVLKAPDIRKTRNQTINKDGAFLNPA